MATDTEGEPLGDEPAPVVGDDVMQTPDDKMGVTSTGHKPEKKEDMAFTTSLGGYQIEIDNAELLDVLVTASVSAVVTGYVTKKALGE